jgi:hypothetical protein
MRWKVPNCRVTIETKFRLLPDCTDVRFVGRERASSSLLWYTSGTIPGVCGNVEYGILYEDDGFSHYLCMLVVGDGVKRRTGGAN